MHHWLWACHDALHKVFHKNQCYLESFILTTIFTVSRPGPLPIIVMPLLSQKKQNIPRLRQGAIPRWPQPAFSAYPNHFCTVNTRFIIKIKPTTPNYIRRPPVCCCDLGYRPVRFLNNWKGVRKGGALDFRFFLWTTSPRGTRGLWGPQVPPRGSPTQQRDVQQECPASRADQEAADIQRTRRGDVTTASIKSRRAVQILNLACFGRATAQGVSAVVSFVAVGPRPPPWRAARRKRLPRDAPRRPSPPRAPLDASRRRCWHGPALADRTPHIYCTAVSVESCRGHGGTHPGKQGHSFYSYRAETFFDSKSELSGSTSAHDRPRPALPPRLFCAQVGHTPRSTYP